MKVVTFATKSDGFFPYFVESANRYNIDVDILGWGQKWEGFGKRLLALANYCAKLSANEVVLFVDSYDLIFLRDLRDLEMEYVEFTRQKGDRIVMSISTAFPLVNRMFFGHCKGFYINGGAYIGYAGLIKQAIDEICSTEKCVDRHADDQRMLTAYCNRESALFDFDQESKWFLTWGLQEFNVSQHVTIDNGILKYKSMMPFVLHSPGNKDMTDMLSRLGYDVTDSKMKRSISTYANGIYWNHLKHFMKNYGVYMFFLMILFIWVRT